MEPKENTQPRDTVLQFLESNDALQLITSDSEPLLDLFNKCEETRENFGTIHGIYQEETGIQVEYLITKTPVKQIEYLVALPYSSELITPREEFLNKVKELTQSDEIDPSQLFYIFKQFTFKPNAKIDVFKQMFTQIITAANKNFTIIQTGNRPPKIQSSDEKNFSVHL